jgi:tetratricopeptide (TPR) repeat protein
VECFEQALAIMREIGDRGGEGIVLGHLGSCYFRLGQVQRAIEHYEQELAIAREIGAREGEGIALGNLARVLIDQQQFNEAIKYALEGLNIVDQINSPFVGKNVYHRLALAHLYLGDLPAARTAIEFARKFDEPTNNHNVLALLGVIALRQSDQAAAREAFIAAIAHSDQLIEFNSMGDYEALDTKGLALSGLALLDGPQHIPAAIAAYRAARAITAAGIVGRALRLHDALAVLDTNGLLAEVRAALQGA